MYSRRSARAASARCAVANPTASNPIASASVRIASRIVAAACLISRASFPRRRESRGRGALSPALDPRFRGGDDVVAMVAGGIWMARSPATAIGGDPGVGQPSPGGQVAGLVEDVDRDAAARIPVAADAQPAGAERCDESARNRQRAVLVKGA